MVEVKYISNRDEQKKILLACHVDPTSGHMGVKQTLNRISERFKWPNMVKDVQDLVSSLRLYIRIGLSTSGFISHPWKKVRVDGLGTRQIV